MLAASILGDHPGEKIVHNLICSKAVPEIVRELGGTPIRTRVGHSFIKQVMAETGAVFGGEHSAHYYFRDNYRADSGIIAALMVLEQLRSAGRPLSELRGPFERYAMSGEINTRVDDPLAVIEHVAARYARRRPGPARRPHRRPRRLVVQPAAEQHRAAAAPQPGGARPRRLRRAHRRGPRPRARHRARPRRTTRTPFPEDPMALDPKLLEILACPEDKGPLLYFADESSLYNPRLQRRYAVRDDIPIMLIDEAETVDDAEARATGRQGRGRRHPAHLRRLSARRGRRHPRASARRSARSRSSSRRRTSSPAELPSASLPDPARIDQRRGARHGRLRASPATSCRPSAPPRCRCR